MNDNVQQIAWNLFCELRKELVEIQKIRAQVIGFKITFVSAAVGVIAANLEKIPSVIFVIPAFASVFFDFLITSYSFSIKRTGYYCRTQLEPILKEAFPWPDDFLFWETFMVGRHSKQNLSFWGNIGLTILVFIVAFIGMYVDTGNSIPVIWRVLTGIVLVLFLTLDIRSFYQPGRFTAVAPTLSKSQKKNS